MEHALKLAREDLCFAVDIFINEHRYQPDDPYILRLLGTIEFITEQRGDRKDFNKTLLLWEKNHNSPMNDVLTYYRRRQEANDWRP